MCVHPFIPFKKFECLLFSKHFLGARDAAVNKTMEASALLEFTLLSHWVCLNGTHHPYGRAAYLLPVASGLRRDCSATFRTQNNSLATLSVSFPLMCNCLFSHIFPTSFHLLWVPLTHPASHPPPTARGFLAGGALLAMLPHTAVRWDWDPFTSTNGQS